MNETHDQQENLPDQKSSKKNKFTTYLTEEAENAFTELYVHRVRKSAKDKKSRKVERSQIICEALIELYKKECGENSQ